MKKTLGVLAVLAGLAVFGIAQGAKTDFSGKWTLNLTKSTAGQFAPTSEVDTITQTADMFKNDVVSESQRGKRETITSAKLDGSDTPNEPPANSPMKILSTKAAWQGSSLVITQQTTFQDNKGSTVTTYTLSDDGKTLTKTSHIDFGQGASNPSWSSTRAEARTHAGCGGWDKCARPANSLLRRQVEALSWRSWRRSSDLSEQVKEGNLARAVDGPVDWDALEAVRKALRPPCGSRSIPTKRARPALRSCCSRAGRRRSGRPH